MCFQLIATINQQIPYTTRARWKRNSLENVPSTVNNKVDHEDIINDIGANKDLTSTNIPEDSKNLTYANISEENEDFMCVNTSEASTLFQSDYEDDIADIWNNSVSSSDSDREIETDFYDESEDSRSSADEDDEDDITKLIDNGISCVYPGSNMSKDEAILSVADLYTNNKMTKHCLQNTLKTVCNMLPANHELPKTNYKFFQFLQKLAPIYKETRNYYCKNCFFL